MACNYTTIYTPIKKKICRNRRLRYYRHAIYLPCIINIVFFNILLSHKFAEMINVLTTYRSIAKMFDAAVQDGRLSDDCSDVARRNVIEVRTFDDTRNVSIATGYRTQWLSRRGGGRRRTWNSCACKKTHTHVNTSTLD